MAPALSHLMQVLHLEKGIAMSNGKQIVVYSHFSAPIIFTVLLGVPWLLVGPYSQWDNMKRRWFHQIKFFGGMVKKLADGTMESPHQTLNREGAEEVFVEPIDLASLAEDPVIITKKDEKNPTGIHLQHFYLIDALKCKKPVRHRIKQEIDGVELGIPRFMHVSELAGENGALFRGHQVPLAALIMHLLCVNKEMLYALDPELLEWATNQMEVQEQKELALRKELER